MRTTALGALSFKSLRDLKSACSISSETNIFPLSSTATSLRINPTQLPKFLSST